MARILVVDDVSMTRRIIELALTGMGHEVVGTCSPFAVPDILRHQMPDLVVLDYFMPGLDGVSLLARLRAEFGGQCPKALFVSSAPYEVVVIGAESLGASGHVSKPFRLRDLRCAVADALGNSHGLSEMRAGDGPTFLSARPG